MKLRTEVDAREFLDAVKVCSNDVYFQTPDGDKVNLKSLLSQFIFADMCRQKQLLSESEIICENEADYNCLSAYISKTE